MHIIYAKENYSLDNLPRPTVFLAGPTPRDYMTRSWRPEAIKHFAEYSFSGTLFIPESRGSYDHDLNYTDQIEWEESGLTNADCIMFWVPREMLTMPGLTTNIEFGAWMHSGKVIFGCPHNAENVRYMKHYCDKLKIPRAKLLDETIGLVIQYYGYEIIK